MNSKQPEKELSMKMTGLKIGAAFKDIASGIEGTVTHWAINMSKEITYIFQPKGLNDEGQPLDKMYMPRARLISKEHSFEEEVDVPVEVLGSEVEDKPSGFSGTAVELFRHPGGCYHVIIQPAGICAKTKSPFKRHDADLRLCKGKKIPEMSEKQRKEDEQKRPSPTGDDFIRMQDQQLPR